MMDKLNALYLMAMANFIKINNLFMKVNSKMVIFKGGESHNYIQDNGEMENMMAMEY